LLLPSCSNSYSVTLALNNIILSSFIYDWRKYEEINANNIEDFCLMTDNTYTREEVCLALSMINVVKLLLLLDPRYSWIMWLTGTKYGDSSFEVICISTVRSHNRTFSQVLLGIFIFLIVFIKKKRNFYVLFGDSLAIILAHSWFLRRFLRAAQASYQVKSLIHGNAVYSKTCQICIEYD